MYKTGIELISDERKQQIEKHGFTVEKDQKYVNDELVTVATNLLTGNFFDYPATWSSTMCDKLRKKNQLESLIISGALIAAEIDRLQDLEKSQSKFNDLNNADFHDFLKI